MGVNELLQTLHKYAEVHQEIGRMMVLGSFRSSAERNESPEWNAAWERSKELMKEMIPEALILEAIKRESAAHLSPETVDELS